MRAKQTNREKIRQLLVFYGRPIQCSNQEEINSPGKSQLALFYFVIDQENYNETTVFFSHQKK